MFYLERSKLTNIRMSFVEAQTQSMLLQKQGENQWQKSKEGSLHNREVVNGVFNSKGLTCEGVRPHH